MKINSIIAGVIASLGALSVTSLQAGLITLTQDSYSYGQGGQFTAHITSQNFASAYSSGANHGLAPGDFATFCIETDVEFYPGGTYNYSLSATDSEGRYLSLGTAYLYSLFATDSLGNYDYNDSSSSRQSENELLQQAIWYLQGGQLYGGDTAISIQSNLYYTLATGLLGATATNANNGTYAVEILRLTDDNGEAAQNQLVYIPKTPDTRSGAIPEPSTVVAGTLLLLPFGVSTLRVLRNRKLASR